MTEIIVIPKQELEAMLARFAADLREDMAAQIRQAQPRPLPDLLTRHGGQSTAKVLKSEMMNGSKSQSDFLKNRQDYRTAKSPLIKGKIYFNRDGERVRYCSTTNFDWFKWVDKPNPDGEFMVSWVYEKTDSR